MTWFLIVGSLLITMPSEEACRKFQSTVPGGECGPYLKADLPFEGWQLLEGVEPTIKYGVTFL